MVPLFDTSVVERRRELVWVSDGIGAFREDGRVIVSSRVLRRLRQLARQWGGPATLVLREADDEARLSADAVSVEPDALPFGLFPVDLEDEYALASTVVDAGMVLVSARAERQKIVTLCQRLSVTCMLDIREARQVVEAA